VTCSPEKPPQPLIDQLKDGGLMIVPTGERYQQTLYLLKKKGDKLETVSLKPTLFVPMTGRAEDSREVQPDPSKPAIINGDFEAEMKEGETVIPGWYYERQHELVREATGAPQGKQFVRFKNQVPERPAHIAQGFPIDGRKIAALDFSLQSSCKDVVVPASAPEAMPSLDVMLFDEGRKIIKRYHIAASKGTQPWKRYEQTVKVSNDVREAIICVGLFGATGEASFDDVSLRAVPRK
jgi:protein-L-isoaspartate(D-aspartate) O-methyltransferase